MQLKYTLNTLNPMEVWELTVIILWRPIIRFVNSCTEALVAAPPPDHVRAGPVEGQQLVFLGFRHGGLKTLQRARLLQT